jgi:TPR repeat protein
MADETALQVTEKPAPTLIDTGNSAGLIERGRKDLLDLTSKALYRKGEAFFAGDGVEQDYVQAAFWFRESADQGYAYAQERLGLMYWMGWGVAPDDVESAAWYRKAAEQGIPRAQYQLGLFYLNGTGVPEDAAKAAALTLKAAEQGWKSAQSWLATIYLKGTGVPSDPQEAYFWSYIADELDAAENGRLSANGPSRTQRIAASLLTDAVLTQTRDRAKQWLAAHRLKTID